MSSSSTPTSPSCNEPPQARISNTSSSSISNDPKTAPKYDRSKYNFLISCIGPPRLINGEPVPDPDPRNYDKEIGTVLAVIERRHRVGKLSLEVKKQRITDYFNELKPSDFASTVGYLREEHPEIDRDIEEVREIDLDIFEEETLNKVVEIIVARAEGAVPFIHPPSRNIGMSAGFLDMLRRI